MDLNRLRELAGLSKAAKPATLKEHVVGDLNNGYNLQHSATKYHSDFFPTGNDYSAEDDAGPASAKHGDSGMQKAIKIDKDDLTESKEIHSQLVYEYRKFKNDSSEKITESPERKALMARYNSGELSYEELQKELDGLNHVDPDSEKKPFHSFKDKYNKDKFDYTDYSMRQGEMGNPDSQR